MVEAKGKGEAGGEGRETVRGNLLSTIGRLSATIAREILFASAASEGKRGERGRG